MPFILRPCGTCPAPGHRITNSVNAIVCATANTPASVRERNYPSLITLLIALSHKLNRAISAPARQCIKMPTVPAKEVFFRFKHKPTVTFSPDYHSLSPPQSVAAHRPFPREGRLSFRTVTSFLQDCFRQGRRQQRSKDKLVLLSSGAVVGLAIRQQQKSPSVRAGRNADYASPFILRLCGTCPASSLPPDCKFCQGRRK